MMLHEKAEVDGVHNKISLLTRGISSKEGRAKQDMQHFRDLIRLTLFPAYFTRVPSIWSPNRYTYFWMKPTEIPIIRQLY